jgi:BatD DUF11 like domain
MKNIGNKMNMKLAITLMLLFFSQFAQSEITIKIDRSPVVVDEAFQLIFESDQKIKTEPDFSPLNKSLTILSTGRRSNAQIINGKVSQSQQWILTVITNKTGIIGIPSIRFGNELSKPYSIKVVVNSSAQGTNNQDIYLEVEVDKKEPYVQAQVIYTITLYRAVQTTNSSITEPKVSGGQAVINKLGEDDTYETRKNGKRYVVTQRKFVIFPQSSGPLKIEPVAFQGQIGASRLFNFDPFGPQPKSIIKRSDSFELDVKPIPDSFTGETWLPASDLSFQEQWSIDPGRLRQGEATTRTLTLKANGLAASHLPVVNNNLPDNLKQYPDQPEFEETNNKSGYIGIRRDKMAIIPTEAGDYILPAIKLPWWNTVTDKMEIAELPERTIHVDVAPGMDVPDNKSAQDNRLPSEQLPAISTDTKTNISNVNQPADQTQWKWISLCLLVLWLVTLFILWKNKQKPLTTDIKKDVSSSKRKALKELQQACSNNDPVLTKQALLSWASVNWPDKSISNLIDIKQFCGQDLQLKIDELNLCLYGQEKSSWNGADFMKIFESQSFVKNQTKAPVGNLEPLYKS